MQEECCCEVIGCERQASWLLVVRQDTRSEDCLCAIHWELLHLQNPRQADRYTPLPACLLREWD